jgi:hypothetical protein
VQRLLQQKVLQTGLRCIVYRARAGRKQQLTGRLLGRHGAPAEPAFCGRGMQRSPTPASNLAAQKKPDGHVVGLPGHVTPAAAAK